MRSRVPGFVLCSFALLWLAGCGGQNGEESAADIARAISESAEFTAPYVMALEEMSEMPCGQALGQQGNWARWVSLGLAEVRPEGGGCRLWPGEETRRELQAHQHLLREPRPGRLEAVLGVRNLTRVLGSRKTGGEIWEAEFEWQWRPNGLGERLQLDAAQHRGWARVGEGNDGWSVMALRLGG